MILIRQYSLAGIYYNAAFITIFTFEHFETLNFFQDTFKYILTFNYTYFLILLKLKRIIMNIYTHIFYSLFNILFGCTHFELCKVKR